jgi:Fe-S-cluster-containing hydrogenase component 2
MTKASDIAVPDSSSNIPCPRVALDDLLRLARDCGADDCGAVSLDDPAFEEDRAYILKAFPATRTMLALVSRTHREPIRSPAKSIANNEWHRVGHKIDDIAAEIVGRLEKQGIKALNPPMAFPMEMDNIPGRTWIVSHKRVAEATGIGRMGIHRSVIHPQFGSFILLNTVLIAAELDQQSRQLDANPCLECKLCVAACPVGAIKPDGYFDFSACLNHNYQQFMGGFANWIEDIADSRSVKDFRRRSSYGENISRWQSLSYGPNYNAANCIAVCPAGNDVIGLYAENRQQHIQETLIPLQEKVEPLYVVRDSDAADFAARRYPHKQLRYVRGSGRALSVRSFLFGIKLTFQRGKSKGLNAVYQFTFTGEDAANATVVIQNQRLSVVNRHEGVPDIRIQVDGRQWVRFLNKETSIVRLLLSRALRIKGNPRLLLKFSKCFPS